MTPYTEPTLPIPPSLHPLLTGRQVRIDGRQALANTQYLLNAAYNVLSVIHNVDLVRAVEVPPKPPRPTPTLSANPRPSPMPCFRIRPQSSGLLPLDLWATHPKIRPGFGLVSPDWGFELAKWLETA